MRAPLAAVQREGMQIPDPRAWLRRRGRALLIDAGRVGCPASGDADLERCFTCGHLVGMSDGRYPRVVCDYRFDNPLASFVRRSG